MLLLRGSWWWWCEEEEGAVGVEAAEVEERRRALPFSLRTAALPAAVPIRSIDRDLAASFETLDPSATKEAAKERR